MPTLLLTHPSCLEHDTGYGHPERADRLRAIDDCARGRCLLEAQARDGAARRPGRDRARASRPLFRRDRGGIARERSRASRPRHRHVAGKPRGRAPCRGRGHLRRGSGHGGRGAKRLLRGAAARSSCRADAAHGLLPVQHCGHRRPARPRRPRRRARGGGRFRRPSRQRHASGLLAGQGFVLRLDPPDAALSRQRRA